MKPFQPPNPDPDRFSRRVSELREALQRSDPDELARRTGAVYAAADSGEGGFTLPVWGREHRLSYPGFVAFEAQTGAEAPPAAQALILYYFQTASGAPEAGRWISFADLPDGRFYNQAFQGYTGRELARAFGEDLAAFERAALSLGGSPQAFAGSAFAFRALPRVPLLAAAWPGDEDFPASYQVLFDASASQYLPTDAYAILGSTLTRRLISNRG